jgi:hypothetical protein
MKYKILILIIFIDSILMSIGSVAQNIRMNHNSRSLTIKQITDQKEKRPEISISDIYMNSNEKQTLDLCTPQYSTGCSEGDGFTDFAVGEIENFGSGCENLNGTGWSQYFDLGPAFLVPGLTYDFEMSTGYGNQYATIWVDYNDDLELTSDEKILTDYVMQNSGTLYTVSVPVPVNAPGGQHIMRARTNWSASCSDPCQAYTYGEAEDYNVIIGEAVFGALGGSVSEVNGGGPVEGALITVSGMYNYSISTGNDGTYLIEDILEGDYTVTCNKTGYNIISSSVTIVEDLLATADFALTQPQILISPSTVSIILLPDSIGEKIINIENPGNGPLDWSASLQILSDKPKDFMDLQFQYPVGVGGGEAGIETDGEFIYTTKWNGAGFYKYGIDGTYLGTFAIAGTSAIRDLAFDGTYFYGGAGLSTVYEMDFANQLLISSFTAPTDCRAIAYNENDDVFYANNWSTPVVKFDKAGANLGSFNVGPAGGEYYGLAYDGATLGGPFLWGYAQVGDSKNEIIQMLLPSGAETGFTLDIAIKLSGTLYNFAGGLYTYPNLVLGKWTLGGLVQNEWIWGLELTDAQTWISVSPASGTLEPGGSEVMTVNFDATEMIPGIYEAQILMTTYPDVGSPVIGVTLTVADETLEPPSNLSYTIDCEIAELCWQVSNPSIVDSFSVYINDYNIVTTDNCCTIAGPGSYECYVAAWYAGLQSPPSDLFLLNIPWPADSQPADFNIDNIVNNLVYTSWQMPSGCALADGYNLYRNGNKVNSVLISELSYSDTVEFGGTYEYYVTAVYYFGESEPSNMETVVITSVMEQVVSELNIFPNPVRNRLFIHSPSIILNLELIGASGLTTYTEIIMDDKYELDLSHYLSGIYFLRLETQFGAFIKKIIIE